MNSPYKGLFTESPETPLRISAHSYNIPEPIPYPKVCVQGFIDCILTPSTASVTDNKHYLSQRDNAYLWVLFGFGMLVS